MKNKNPKILEFKKELVAVFSKLPRDRESVFLLLKDILTPSEFETLALRWQIVKKLKKGDDQRSIAGELRLGLGTVTRGSRMLRNKKGGFHLMLEKLGE